MKYIIVWLPADDGRNQYIGPFDDWGSAIGWIKKKKFNAHPNVRSYTIYPIVEPD